MYQNLLSAASKEESETKNDFIFSFDIFVSEFETNRKVKQNQRWGHVSSSALDEQVMLE